MKWFFSLNSLSASFHEYARMVKTAVYSAHVNAPLLEPHFLYDGEENELTVWMNEHGVPIVPHRVSLYSDLEILYKKSNGNHFLSIGSGVFMRIDLPEIMLKNHWEDEYVLYTDADVMFLKQPDFSSFPCRFFAVAPEMTIQDNININTGVMLMNISNLGIHQPEFLQFMKNHLKQLCDLDWDQTAYRAYYHLEWQNLPPEMNWKPYWGYNPEACIIHFHGLKPTYEAEARAGALTGRLKEIHDLAGDTYYKMAAIWRNYAEGAEGSFHFNPSGCDVVPCDSHLYFAENEPYRDQLRTKSIQRSDFVTVIENQLIQEPSWRVIKGELILWLFSQEDPSEGYLVTSRFFCFIEDFDAALLHARMAHKNAPESISVITWLAQVLFLRGEMGKAKQVLEIGSHLAPNDVQLLNNIGCVNLELGEYSDALTNFRNAQAIDPGNLEALRGIQIVLRFFFPPAVES